MKKPAYVKNHSWRKENKRKHIFLFDEDKNVPFSQMIVERCRPNDKEILVLR